MSLRKAIQVASFGGPEVLQLCNVPIPSVNSGQLLIKIHAVGVNPVDTYIRNGTHVRKPSLPYIPGADAAGIVKTVGDGVTSFKEGDRVYVYSLNGLGTYTELALCDEKDVYKLHPSLTFKQGAALGIAYMTAYRALFHKLKIKKGETLFIHGASGGVGLAAVQMAKAQGLCVFGTASTDEGKKLVLESGAHNVFDHKEIGYMDKVMEATNNVGVDAILENLANINLAKDLDLLANNGRISIVGSRGNVEINPRALMLRESCVMGVALAKATRHELSETARHFEKWSAEGWLKPVVGKTFKLSNVSQAHKDIIEGTARGKLVLEVD